MSRAAVAFLVAWLGFAAAASGAVTMTFDPVLTQYAPGGSVSFDVNLAGVTNLNLYQINLFMMSDDATAVPNVDFRFDAATTHRPADDENRYIFDEDVSGFEVEPFGFSAVAGVDGPMAVLTLYDYLLHGQAVDTVAGLNDIVAHVTVVTTGDVGRLWIGVLGDDRLTLAGEGTVEYPETLPSMELEPAPVPEAASLVVWLVLASLGAALGWRLRRNGSA